VFDDERCVQAAATALIERLFVRATDGDSAPTSIAQLDDDSERDVGEPWRAVDVNTLAPFVLGACAYAT
jgi:hypothetical protein